MANPDPSFDPQRMASNRDPGGEPYDDPEAAAAEQRGQLSEDDRVDADFSTPQDRDEAEEQSARQFAVSEGDAPLLTAEHASGLKTQWDAVQATFVDDPRRAVENADHLVAQAMARLADTFAQERANLEQQWGRGQEASTEDLRQALQRYRAFFQRLLAV